MRYEYKIKMDADLYGMAWPSECPDLARGAVESLKNDLKAVFESYGYSHLFGGVQITVVPHDNDREYDDIDAERQLNGEPKKKRKTYAEDFFEKFPQAEHVAVLTAHEGVKQIPAVKFIAVYPPKVTPKVDPRQDAMSRNIQMWLSEIEDE